MRSERLVVACTTTIAVSLLLVGAVSGTVIRHVIQIVPVVVAALLGARRSPLAPWAALPLFVFWLFIMTLIWLFLLGVSSLVTGHFSPAEIVLTVAIGIASLVGAIAVIRTRSETTWGARVAVFVLFAALQIAAMWTSMRPAVATR
jgi:hypothetical protein